MEPLKSGWQTSEFWMALAVVVLGAVAQTFAASPLGQLAGAIAQGLATAGYAVGRAMNKSAATHASAAIECTNVQVAADVAASQSPSGAK